MWKTGISFPFPSLVRYRGHSSAGASATPGAATSTIMSRGQVGRARKGRLHTRVMRRSETRADSQATRQFRRKEASRRGPMRLRALRVKKGSASQGRSKVESGSEKVGKSEVIGTHERSLDTARFEANALLAIGGLPNVKGTRGGPGKGKLGNIVLPSAHSRLN